MNQRFLAAALPRLKRRPAVRYPKPLLIALLACSVSSVLLFVCCFLLMNNMHTPVIEVLLNFALSELIASLAVMFVMDPFGMATLRGRLPLKRIMRVAVGLLIIVAPIVFLVLFLGYMLQLIWEVRHDNWYSPKTTHLMPPKWRSVTATIAGALALFLPFGSLMHWQF